MSIPSIESLPVELFHQIFDNLDSQTIILSLRLVSKLFQSVVQTYTGYVLDFQLISKNNFHALCRLIHPPNVISLTLSNHERTSDQIDIFLYSVHLQQFTHLRSLILLHIDEYRLSLIFEQINFTRLTSLSFKISKYDELCAKTTVDLLSLIFQQTKLYKLECGLEENRLSKITWPIDCTIQYLTITGDMTLDNLFTILQCSPYLHTLIIKINFSKMIRNKFSSSSFPIYFRQLTSLTIEYFDVSIDDLEFFLSLIPSLIYLKIIGIHIQIDGKRWERFIEVNLPYLTEFVFYFIQRNGINQSENTFQQILASFQTPFWIEHKKWFVIGEYYLLSKNIRLYSIPICINFMFYEPKSQVITSSTYPSVISHNSSMINHVKTINLRLNEDLVNDLQRESAINNHPLFSNATKIILDCYGNRLLFPLQYLSVYIDISKIVQIELNSDGFENYNEMTWREFRNFLLQAQNLSTLTFWNTSRISEMYRSIDIISLIIPHYIKHLQIPINNVNQIENILNRCENLITIKFDIKSLELSKGIMNWFKYNTINSTCLEENNRILVWIGKKRCRLNNNNKRIKLNA